MLDIKEFFSKVSSSRLFHCLMAILDIPSYPPVAKVIALLSAALIIFSIKDVVLDNNPNKSDLRKLEKSVTDSVKNSENEVISSVKDGLKSTLKKHFDKNTVTQNELRAKLLNAASLVGGEGENSITTEKLIQNLEIAYKEIIQDYELSSPNFFRIKAIYYQEKILLLQQSVLDQDTTKPVDLFQKGLSTFDQGLLLYPNNLSLIYDKAKYLWFFATFSLDYVNEDGILIDNENILAQESKEIFTLFEFIYKNLLENPEINYPNLLSVKAHMADYRFNRGDYLKAHELYIELLPYISNNDVDFPMSSAIWTKINEKSYARRWSRRYEFSNKELHLKLRLAQTSASLALLDDATNYSIDALKLSKDKGTKEFLRLMLAILACNTGDLENLRKYGSEFTQERFVTPTETPDEYYLFGLYFKAILSILEKQDFDKADRLLKRILHFYQSWSYEKGTLYYEVLLTSLASNVIRGNYSVAEEIIYQIEKSGENVVLGPAQKFNIAIYKSNLYLNSGQNALYLKSLEDVYSAKEKLPKLNIVDAQIIWLEYHKLLHDDRK